ncbi:MAG: Maf family protein [Phycisphaerales bacterium]|jgi:septum formation protein|nr:Maf family protein [Phycisphaerales bacterium]
MRRGRLILASRSPRRRELLEAAGWEVIPAEATVDDGELHPGKATPAAWTTALAWLKARSTQRALAEAGSAVDAPIVAGDTVCELDGVIVGQPASGEAAAAMIRLMRGTSHRVWTGLCVIPRSGRRQMAADHALVTMGSLTDAQVDAYVASGGWQGKAGAYNLADRIEAGWPIHHDGHASTIMGMPLPLLEQLLEATRRE